MRILMLATQALEPPLDGGALRIAHILRLAAKRHEVTFLGMRRSDQDPSSQNHEIDAAARAQIVPRPAGFLARSFNAAKSLVTNQPYNLGLYTFSDFRKAIADALHAEQFDLVHAHHLHTAQYFPQFRQAATYYDAQNIYAELWRGYAAIPGRNWFLRDVATRQAALVAKVEGQTFHDFDVTTMCSDTDRDRALEQAPGAPIHVVPNGVDCDYFAPQDKPEDRFSIVFTGAMDVPANVDACLYFTHEILPRLRRAYPATKVYFVGKHPTPAVQRLASPNIVVTGTVPDVRPYQARAEAIIAPLRSGSGTRLKILEGMAMAKPVVATPIAAEGLRCADGEDLLIADSPESFATAVGRLFDQVEERRRLGEAARRLVREHYDWNRLESQLDDLYRLAVTRARARSAAL